MIELATFYRATFTGFKRRNDQTALAFPMGETKSGTRSCVFPWFEREFRRHPASASSNLLRGLIDVVGASSYRLTRQAV